MAKITELQLRNLRKQGKTIMAMAAECGCSAATIKYWCAKFGISLSLAPAKPKLCAQCCLPKATRRGKYCSAQCLQDALFDARYAEFLAGGQPFIEARSIKRALLRRDGKKCSCCFNSEWQGKPIPLELEHVDGDSENNTSENLKLLCPNCHAQTPTYKSKNVGKGRHFRRQRYAEGKSY